MFDTTKDRPIKKKITQGLFAAVKTQYRQRVFKCFFCLPSTTCVCIKSALEFGLIDLDTAIIAVEYNKNKVDEVRKTLESMGFTKVFVFGKKLTDVNTFDLNVALTHLRQTTVDLAYLDTCSYLSQCMQEWIENFSRSTDKDAVILTNFVAARNVKDVQKYNILPYYVAAFAKNPNANAFATCLHIMTKKQTQLLLSYKEKGLAHPMIVSFNGKSSYNLADRFKHLQNLGYR